ncbi:glycosyltransferase family 1 protein [Geobacillus stearothermophilus]|uniref:glycosyltransferase family 4 protein n=1 Tax=Geobacillus stearothermophilus TaxID=1422 RepID=UPI002E1D8937|nr:glycosyltransferase family 1 protein [Geobacillus stearothermophilus]MED3752119.1 glycosyltransferase family 1 protein [Geobacillus stearothermophilus]
MIVGIDARKLNNSKTGIGYYTENILSELLNLDRKNKYILYMDDDHKGSDKWGCYENVSIKVIGRNIPKNKIFSPIWLNILLPYHLNKDKVDVLFCPNFFPPLFTKAKRITTIHDLAVFKQPECYPFLYRIYHRMLLLLTIRKNDYILTVSQSSKNDLLETFKHLQERDNIYVTYCAVNKEKFRVKEELDSNFNKEVIEKYGLDSKYILFLGELNKRKNILHILKTFKLMIDEGFSEYKLVLCGKEGYGFDEIISYINENSLENKVIITGYVPEEEIPYLYANASLFFYPSLYEGFGIPPLESMASGVPAVVSNISSLPEVVGDAGIKVPPYDERQSFNSIKKHSR